MKLSATRLGIGLGLLLAGVAIGIAIGHVASRPPLPPGVSRQSLERFRAAQRQEQARLEEVYRRDPAAWREGFKVQSSKFKVEDEQSD